MNGIVGSVCNCDQELWVEDTRVSTRNIGNRHWVHVMDGDSLMNFVTWHAQIAALVTDDDMVTKLTPFYRSIELLIHVPVEAKRRHSNCSMKSEILVAFSQRTETSQLRVRSNPHRAPSVPDRNMPSLRSTLLDKGLRSA